MTTFNQMSDEQRYSGDYYDEDYCSYCEEHRGSVLVWYEDIMESNSQALQRLLVEHRKQEGKQ